MLLSIDFLSVSCSDIIFFLRWVIASSLTSALWKITCYLSYLNRWDFTRWLRIDSSSRFFGDFGEGIRILVESGGIFPSTSFAWSFWNAWVLYRWWSSRSISRSWVELRRGCELLAWVCRLCRYSSCYLRYFVTFSSAARFSCLIRLSISVILLRHLSSWLRHESIRFFICSSRLLLTLDMRWFSRAKVRCICSSCSCSKCNSFVDTCFFLFIVIETLDISSAFNSSYG